MTSTKLSGATKGSRLVRARLAMLKVDVVESVRLSDDTRDETHVARRWRNFLLDVESGCLPQHRGRVVHREGDGMLIAAPRALDALRIAFELQARLPAFNRGYATRSHLFLRIGVHEGRVLVDQRDLYGRGVNLAARLKDLAQPGETVVSADVRHQLAEGVDGVFEDLGECHLKHMRLPVRAYRVREPSARQQLPLRQLPKMATPDRAELQTGVAVLPFDTTADSPMGATAGDLFADVLIASLSRGTHLRLVSRMSTNALKGRALDATTVCRMLGTAYMVSGRVVASGKRLAVVCELHEGRSGDLLWSRARSASIHELLNADSDLVAGTAYDVCDVILRRELEWVASRPLPNVASYSLLLGGIALMHRFASSDFQRAKACFERLIERAPRHAASYAWLARWHVFRVVQGWSDSPRSDWAHALELCQRARDLDANSAIALTVEGSVRVRLDKDLDRAADLYRDALRVNPSEPMAELLLGTTHTFKGEGVAAVHHAERAVALTPLDPMGFFYDSHAGAAHLTAGNVDRAIELSQRSLRSNRLHFSTLHTLAISLSLSGRQGEAQSTVKRVLEYEPHLTAAAFLERSPGGRFSHAKRFALALVQAGLPPGEGFIQDFERSHV